MNGTYAPNAQTIGAEILSEPKHNHLGTDAEGDHHYWSRATNVVMTITDDAERPQRYKVDDVSNWIRYVADRRGWSCLRFTDLRDFAAGEAVI